MANFVELTQENGAKITVNTDMIASFLPLGGDPLRGTAVSFAFSAGEKHSARTIRVIEPYIEVTKLLSRK